MRHLICVFHLPSVAMEVSAADHVWKRMERLSKFGSSSVFKCSVTNGSGFLPQLLPQLFGVCIVHTIINSFWQNCEKIAFVFYHIGVVFSTLLDFFVVPKATIVPVKNLNLSIRMNAFNVSLWTKSLSVTWHPNGSFTKLLFIKLDNNMVLKKKKKQEFQNKAQERKKEQLKSRWIARVQPSKWKLLSRLLFK